MPITPSPRQILLVQTVTGGIALCTGPLQMIAGLIRNRDYTAFTNTTGVEEVIFLDGPQLLLIDTFHGEMDQVIDFVRDLRRRNPEVVAVAVATRLNDEKWDSLVFDRYVDMNDDDWGQQMADAIHEFQIGNLRRTPPAV